MLWGCRPVGSCISGNTPYEQKVLNRVTRKAFKCWSTRPNLWKGSCSHAEPPPAPPCAFFSPSPPTSARLQSWAGSDEQ